MLSTDILKLIVSDRGSSEADKQEAHRQLEPAAEDLPFSAPNLPRILDTAFVHNADKTPADPETLPPVPLEKELITFVREEFRGDQVPYFARLDFQCNPKFDRKAFEIDFRATWINSSDEIGMLPWVPFVCIAKFTDSLADRDWAEGGPLWTLWNRWCQERLMNFGLINVEANHELQKRLDRHATDKGEVTPNTPEFHAELPRLREVYPALLWGRAWTTW